ncbi:hypothetical protein C5167_047621 [Papaver somniferum]|uniref:Conserved oligomeric Golgi complex subunit 8 n=1 Tax=Papaver somniferum TaxID=3469 RepID=A0A4Y7LHW4_PAPSO|nr:hypothetical protein C5167_047621 [Papaver somniferum]
MELKLLSQLLQKLRSNIQLPECLRIIGHLRRIEVPFRWSQFLRCRESWLAGILDDLDQRNVYDYLKGMVNCFRMHLFDVVNQYKAIFADDKSGSEQNYDGGLLFSWAMHQITSLLKTLKTMLPKITEGGSLSNILDQCMYCAMGLGWVGLDFRGLLPPLFEDAVLNLFSKNMATAVENFQVVLDSHRWVAALPTGFSTNGPSAESQEDVTPPSYLMEHPPLAIFVNAAMNELRPCAPVSLKLVLAQEVIKGLRAVSDSLMLYNATRMLRQNESQLFLSLCRVFLESVYSNFLMAAIKQEELQNPNPPKLQIYPTASTGISPLWKEKYEKDAKKYWDVFYKRHQDKIPLVATYRNIFVHAYFN